MQINGNEYLIGADPEVFMGLNGKFVSAHNAVPGSKRKPFLVQQGAVQVDGMALEFNIDPAHSFEEFSSNLDIVQGILGDMIGPHEFLKESSVKFDSEFLEGIPYRNIRIGCQPDYNGWTLDQVSPPDELTHMRTAGGHIHIGGFNTDDPYHPSHFNIMAKLACILDEMLGVYSILWDGNDERRDMYGKAGSFRPKKYGMEYRTLSNSWIFNKDLVRFVYDAVKDSINNVLDSSYRPNPVVANIINTSDRGNIFFNGNEKVRQLGY